MLKINRVGADLTNGVISDGSGTVSSSNDGAVRSAPLGAPFVYELSDADGAASKDDCRVAGGAKKKIVFRCDTPFAPRELVVDSAVAAYFKILHMNNGNKNLLPNGDSNPTRIACSTFSEVSTTNPRRLFEAGTTIQPTIGLTIEVLCTAPAGVILAFDATLLGDMFEQN